VHEDSRDIRDGRGAPDTEGGRGSRSGRARRARAGLRSRPRGLAAAVGGLVVGIGAAVLGGCAVPDPVLPQYPDVGPVKVTSSSVIGHEVVTDIYGLALRRAGALVEFTDSEGSTSDAYDRVASGDAGFTTAYTGQLLSDLEGATGEGSPTSEEGVRDAMVDALPEGLVAGPMAKAEDKPEVFVTKHTQDTMGLSAMSDLAGRCGDLRLASTAANAEDPDLQQALRGYDCSFSSVDSSFTSPYDIRDTVRGGRAGAGIAFSTDPTLFPPDLIPLEDDRQLVRAQNFVPIFDEGLLGDDQMAALRKVSAKLTTQEVVSLNASVESGRTPAIVAASGWLNGNGFDSALDAG